MNLAFLNIGTQEMMLIILVALLLFGGKKLPELARGLGRGIREFKDASEGIKREISDQINNFEKEIEDVKADIEKEPETRVAEQQPVESSEVMGENGEELAKNEKKAPQFTAPSGTYEHQPYQTPTADDYYSYGYNDHFANNDSPETPADEASETNTAETPSTENNPSKEEPTKNA